jgi:antitoxin CptB
MTDSPDPLELRRRRLLWRATHRGTKEMDLVIGGYAGARLAGMGAAELDVFEGIIAREDTELTAWIIGRDPVPEALSSPMLAEILAWRVNSGS